MTLSTRGARPAARCRRDEGAALVEFALVSVLLLTLVFAIINFGLILSFKQDVTRAAAEGARAAAVAFPASDAVADATAATQEALDDFNQTCVPGDGMTCTVTQHDCGDPVPDPTGLEAGEPDCVQVELVYDYEDHPLLVPVPLISAFLPDEIRATSDARLNE